MRREGLQQGQQVGIFSLSSRVEPSKHKSYPCACLSKTNGAVFQTKKLLVCGRPNLQLQMIESRDG